MMKGRNMLGFMKVSQRKESVSDFLKKKEVSTEKCSSEKGGKHQVDFQQKDRTRIKSADKICLEERAAQSWDLVGTGVSNVIFLQQFSLWYCWCVQGYVSRQQHCSKNELWANKTVILDHLWNFTLLQAVTGWGYEKSPCFVVLFEESLNTEIYQG